MSKDRRLRWVTPRRQDWQPIAGVPMIPAQKLFLPNKAAPDSKLSASNAGIAPDIIIVKEGYMK
jgi:hypothetical protein